MNKKSQIQVNQNTKSILNIKSNLSKNSMPLIMSPYLLKQIHINKHQSLNNIQQQLTSRINQQIYQRSLKKLQQRYQTIDRWKLKYHSKDNKYIIKKQQSQNTRYGAKLPTLRLSKNIQVDNALAQAPNHFWTQLKVKKAKVNIKTNSELEEERNKLIKRHSKCHFMVQPTIINRSNSLFPIIRVDKYHQTQSLQYLIQKLESQRIIEENKKNQLLTKVIEGNPERWDMNYQQNNEINDTGQNNLMRMYENSQ